MSGKLVTGLMKWDGSMTRLVKRTLILGFTFFSLVLISSCGKKQLEITQTKMEKAGSYNLTEKKGYSNEGVKETVEQSYISPDGLCIINKMQSYYDVTLDYSKGNAEQVGRAYASVILKSISDYENVMEPYLFENIRISLGSMGRDYDSLLPRMEALYESLPYEYKAEVKGFAEEISKGEHGFIENGSISYEEGILMQMVPDALRGTACSALSLWGEKTLSGKNIMCRNLEWNLGSEEQMSHYHAVVHMSKGNKSITNITVLGLIGILTAVNNEGVFAAILDVGSNGENFEYENKKCYTYELRKALEVYTNAIDVGNFMVDNSSTFTFSHNIALSDNNGSYCAEDAVESLQKSGKGYSVLRAASTPIFEGLHWETKDAFFVLNSFASINNQDTFSVGESNIVRCAKFNSWLKSKGKFNLADVKEMLTQEKVDQDKVVAIHSKNVFHTVIIDYETGIIQAAFSSPEGKQDKSEFISIGHY